MNKIETAINKANLGDSKLSDKILSLDGMSSSKVRHLLNNLIDTRTRYLEIGAWKGSTTISALYGNIPEYHCIIDNFSQFGNVKQEFITNCKTHLGFEPNLIDEDFISIDISNITNINVYFYDGDHTEESQTKAITYYYSSLADECILIIDDFNYISTRIGTFKGIDICDLKIIDEYILPAKCIARGIGDLENWWNGLYIALVKK